MSSGSEIGGLNAITRSINHMASSTPTTPPASASNTLSVSNCRTNRARLAPNDKRIAISLRRPAARATNSPARFVHAISNTSATVSISTPAKPMNEVRAVGNRPVLISEGKPVMELMA